MYFATAIFFATTALNPILEEEELALNERVAVVEAEESDEAIDGWEILFDDTDAIADVESEE